MEMVDRILQIEKRKHIETEGVELYPSEIHLMLHVADEQATNLTRIAERLGITKGALSQKTAKLMVFTLVLAAAKKWRRLNGRNQLPKIIEGIKFTNGVEVTDDAETSAA